MAREGPIGVVLFAGEHKAVYELADKSAFVVPKTGAPRLIRLTTNDDSADDLVSTHTDPLSNDDLGPSILEHWTNAELNRIGFDIAVP